MRSHARSNMRRRMEERWAGMTPEQWDEMRQRFRARCGFGPPAPGPSEKGPGGA